MWIYEKRLQYPVNIRHRDLRMAQLMFAQYGGPDSELAAGLRYLAQRYTMPTEQTRALLTDIGTEELGHWEMIGTMIYQLSAGASTAEIANSPLAQLYPDHGTGLFPSNPTGVPFTAAYIGIKGDPVADLTEDMAAEQKARATYEHLMRMTDDPDVIDPLCFLREREIVHFQRFGEALDSIQRMQTKCRCR